MFGKKRKSPDSSATKSQTGKQTTTEDKTVPVQIKDHRDSNGGHPHIIVDDVDNNHVSVGLTTQKKKGKNHPNYPLSKSPLNDGKKSYIRRQGTVAPKKEYNNPRTGEMTSEDYEKAKEYGERAKRRYLDSHKKK